MENKEMLLSVRDLTVEYTSEDEVVHAVNHVSFDLARGSTIGLVGETGAGKTSIARAILRILPEPPARVPSGEIVFEGRNLLTLREEEMQKIRGKEISMIFQDPMTALNPIMRVGEQIAEVVRLHEHCSKAEGTKKAKEMLEMVGIPGERYYEYPHQFSGGMKQRVVIAMALACNPTLLLADEPTTALDVTIQAQVLELMKDLINNRDMSMLMITHSLGIVAEVCDDMAVMYAGRIVEKGTVDDVFNNMRHPYTEGLFNSLPNLKEQGEMLEPIKGLMPDPADLPPGCTFAPRCPYATEACSASVPELHSVDGSKTHFVACHAYSRPGFALRRNQK